MKRFFLYLPVFSLGATISIIVFWLLLVFSDPESGTFLIVGRFLTGFRDFLTSNLPAISWNAATWVPGLGAFVIALLFVHRYLSRWAKRTGRQWSFLTSFCLVMIVPVLFVISFIVPGVLLQWDALGETVWINVR